MLLPNPATPKIRATSTDHVIDRGLTMQKARQRAEPSLSYFTVASVIWTGRLEYGYEVKFFFTICTISHVSVG